MATNPNALVGKIQSEVTDFENAIDKLIEQSPMNDGLVVVNIPLGIHNFTQEHFDLLKIRYLNVGWESVTRVGQCINFKRKLANCKSEKCLKPFTYTSSQIKDNPDGSGFVMCPNCDDKVIVRNASRTSYYSASQWGDH